MRFATLAMTISLSVLMTGPAFAYLDPGTGSMILQGIIGGIAAGITIISLYYQKLKFFFIKRFGKHQSDSNSSE